MENSDGSKISCQNDKINLLDALQQLFRLEAEKSAKNLYRTAALCGAAGCLAEVKDITDPIEQVKYLYEKFLHSDLKFQVIPWAWLKDGIEKKLITKLPNEDWVIAVFISGAHFEGGPTRVLQFLSKIMM